MKFSAERPKPEYGEWTRGNVGEVGRPVTTWHPVSTAKDCWFPIVSWEKHPDEAASEGQG
jgi:hypothetical protein